MKKILILAVVTLLCININAQNDKIQLNVNENISTHITFPEPVLYVDISNNNIVGDIPIDNILRIKPIMIDSAKFNAGDLLSIVTVVTERYKKQFACYYCADMKNAVTDFNISSNEMESYINPKVSLPSADMYQLAWKMWNSKEKFYDISKEAYKLKIKLLNIYTVGDYFFIDVAFENKTKIKYDVDQIRFKIEDKKQTKATNFQQIEIQPTMSLMTNKSFQKNYRNVFVFKKFTFPDEKVFTIEIAEQQISGRTVILRVDYADVLNADSFNKELY